MMCINDKKWLRMFGLALLGLCLYLFDTGSDTWVGYTLIQNCHIRFGGAVLCLVYVLPGLLFLLEILIDPDNQDSFIDKLLLGCTMFVFFVPISVLFLVINLIKRSDEYLNYTKR